MDMWWLYVPWIFGGIVVYDVLKLGARWALKHYRRAAGRRHIMRLYASKPSWFPAPAPPAP